MSFIPVILAGGSGTRLWPMSRQAYPKQFLCFDDTGETFLQKTLSRLDGIDCLPPIVICNELHRFIVAEQLQAMGCDNATIILEPCGRNTAPAIAVAALVAQKQHDNSPLLVLSADHLIENTALFHEAITQALTVEDSLVTFGIKPRYPETGYGYIQAHKKDSAVYSVERFVEKPNAELAQAYVDSGEYYWNSGMFLFTPNKYLQELESYAKDIYQDCLHVIQGLVKDLDFLRIDAQAFEHVRDESIDYAVMEKSQSVKMVPFEGLWSDIGSWKSLAETSDHDEQGNVLLGDVIAINTSNTFVHAKEKLVAVIGLEDIVVVDSDNALLVAHKLQAQHVKDVVQQLKQEDREESRLHRKVFRPWGNYDSIAQGERYKVKKIIVKPGEKLSVQMHHHRAEHWIVVSGTAKVTIDEKTFLVNENESTYIPVGKVHALENPGKLALELIEVQSGSYLEEDDIVRFEDRYGRS